MNPVVIEGAKGKSGGGRTPTEAKDSLRSKQWAEVVDLVSEGEIVGLVNGLKSVYLDGVPIENADGSRNFVIDSFATTVGTQGQPALQSFDTAQSEVAVGIRARVGIPVVRSIPAGVANRVRVTVGIPELSQQSVQSGDLLGSSVAFAIDIQTTSGGFVERWSRTVEGKTTTRYQTSVVIDLPGSGPWDVRLRRLTADSTSVTLRNETWFDSYTLINTAKLRYPNSALAALRVDAEHHQRVPTRAYHMRGRIIRVPSNYNPTTRSYTGAWNGQFKLAYSNNAAWVYFDLATHTRYGLGRRVTITKFDKWQLYAIARYCDAVNAAGQFVGVPDGRGGMEPRFTANLYLQRPAEAYKVLQDMAAIFRAILSYGGSAFSVQQDAPSDAYSLFVPANVVDGVFKYEGSARGTKKSGCIVWWNNPDNQYKLEPEFVSDPDLVVKYGVENLELSPIGCTSRGQALRLAKWALYTEAHEGETVSFSVGSIGAAVPMGRVFQIADPNVTGEQLGGLVSTATATQVTLDREVELRGGESYTLHVMVPDTTQVMGLRTISRPVVTGAGKTTLVTLSSALDVVPPTQSVWVLESSAVAPTSWRCIRLAEGKAPNTYDIVGVAHQPGKYDWIELGLKFDEKPVSRMREDAPVATGLSLRETVYRASGVATTRVTVGWVPAAPGMHYRVTWRTASGQWVTEPNTAGQSIDIDGVSPGLLDVSVQTINPLGTVSGRTLDGQILITGRGGDATNLVLKATFEDGVPGGWGGVVEQISPPTQWTRALLVTQRDTIETDSIFPVTPGERLYVAATLTAWRTPWPVRVGVTCKTAAGADLFVPAVTRPAGGGWAREANWLVIPEGAVTARPWIQILDDQSGSIWPGAWVTDIRISASEPAATRGAPEGTLVGSKAAEAVVQELNDMASDGKVTPLEKSSAIQEWQAIDGERAGLLAEATRYGIVIERSSYDAEVTNLANYLFGLVPGWSDTTTTTPIDPAVWRARWLAARLARETLRNRIAAVTKQGLDDALSRIGEISADSMLTGTEKSALIISWREVDEGLPLMLAQANALGIVPERDAAVAARAALAAYLGSLVPAWNDPATTTPIDAAVFRDRWAVVYSTRNALGMRIAEETSKRATWSSVSGAGKPEDGATVGAAFGVNIGGQINEASAATYIAGNSITESASLLIPSALPVNVNSPTVSANASGVLLVLAVGGLSVGDEPNPGTYNPPTTGRLNLVVNGVVVAQSVPATGRSGGVSGQTLVPATISWSGAIVGPVTAYVVARRSNGSREVSVMGGTTISIICLKR